MLQSQSENVIDKEKYINKDEIIKNLNEQVSEINILVGELSEKNYKLKEENNELRKKNDELNEKLKNIKYIERSYPHFYVLKYLKDIYNIDFSDKDIIDISNDVLKNNKYKSDDNAHCFFIDVRIRLDSIETIRLFSIHGVLMMKNFLDEKKEKIYNSIENDENKLPENYRDTIEKIQIEDDII